MDDEYMKNLEEELKKQKDQINRRPIEDFDNLSPEDMHNLMYKPFQEESPIQFKKEILNSVLDEIPFLNLVEYLMNKVKAEEKIKLTPKGNLPTKLVKELYHLELIKEYPIEEGITKLSREDDSLSITNAKIISMLSGLMKKKHGYLNLTKNGEKMLLPKNRQQLLKKIFEIYGYKFNLAYHDGFQDRNETQTCLSYTLFQLLKNGKEEKNVSFYSDKMLRAYPHLLAAFKERSYSTPPKEFQNCYKVRLMERFLNWFNFIEFREERKYGGEAYVKAKLLDEVLEIRSENFKFIKEKFLA